MMFSFRPLLELLNDRIVPTLVPSPISEGFSAEEWYLMYVSADLPLNVDWNDPESYGPVLWGDEVAYEEVAPPDEEPVEEIIDDAGTDPEEEIIVDEPMDDAGADPEEEPVEEIIADTGTDPEEEPVEETNPEDETCDEGLAPVPPDPLPTMEEYETKKSEYNSKQEFLLDDQLNLGGFKTLLRDWQDKKENITKKVLAEQAKPLALQNNLLLAQWDAALVDGEQSRMQLTTNMGTLYSEYIKKYDVQAATHAIMTSMNRRLTQAGQAPAAVPVLPPFITFESLLP